MPKLPTSRRPDGCKLIAAEVGHRSRRVDTAEIGNLGPVYVADARDHFLIKECGAQGASIALNALDELGHPGLGPQRVGAEAGCDQGDLRSINQPACHRAGQVGSGAGIGEGEPCRRRRRRGRKPVRLKLPNKPEVDMENDPALPPIEQMFAVRIDHLERSPAEARRTCAEPPLRGRGGNRSTSESFAMGPSDTVNGVALGHGGTLLRASSDSDSGPHRESPSRVYLCQPSRSTSQRRIGTRASPNHSHIDSKPAPSTVPTTMLTASTATTIAVATNNTRRCRLSDSQPRHLSDKKSLAELEVRSDQGDLKRNPDGSESNNRQRPSDDMHVGNPVFTDRRIVGCGRIERVAGTACHFFNPPILLAWILVRASEESQDT